MRATLEPVKLTGTVQNGNVAVDLPEGTPVTILVEESDLPPGPYVDVDERGDVLLTPELEARLEEAESSSELVPLAAALESLRNRNG